ncbi:MAG: hypothetical protein CO113_18965 [Elusimicrobia bacterium CG_4_9_14_3_um_filter_62_55]|nr:MAG: hypothetical protein COR54_02605 [Elusimicrobia bacterium CG22_combo_CG10-13_8_21_14_all_63_91]PJA13719.1 MAG: hypothetical protein COX66_14345 [Elusimicrobia bacterium CG_4_10_14_0_2_um_filter_63_34]PJB23160.1 MAG: hypothetical protein CO113_18965 [Elusimicrobia bacterium CG_4_9_14_3_um_filter_62_55]
MCEYPINSDNQNEQETGVNSISTQFSAFTLSAILCLAGPTAAVAQNLDEEIQRPATATDRQQSALETADRAEAKRVVEGETGVTYADVLKDPDNIGLNYKFAKTQVADGDLKGAAATLERILMIDPALPKIRLFYGIVLYRLGNLHEALRELESIRKLPMDGGLKGEIEAYISRIQKQMRRTNWRGMAGVGFQFDDNRNASPSTGKKLFLDTPLTLTTGLRRSDFSALFLLGAGMEHDLGLQGGHKLFANLTYYRSEQTLVDSLDLQVYNWDFGTKLNGGRWGEWSVALPFDHMRLSEETYLRTYGLRVDWNKRLNNKLGLYTQVQGSKHDYVKTADVPTARERTGNHFHIDWGAQYAPAPAHQLTGGLGYTRQQASRDYFAYDRWKIEGKHAWLLGKGRFLLSGVTVQVDGYDEKEAAISAKVRHDETVRLASTFGYPMGNLWSPLKNVLWTFTYEYYHANSNIMNYAYTNNKVATMFTYRWDR